MIHSYDRSLVALFKKAQSAQINKEKKHTHIVSYLKKVVRGHSRSRVGDLEPSFLQKVSDWEPQKPL